MDQPDITSFNVRVYALIHNLHSQVLLCDEYLFDQFMTKFPGGGMYFGEGTTDCLLREANEEFGQEIEIIEHFYTTDFFQRALFFSNQQLLSIYYRARFIEPPRFRISDKPFDFVSPANGSLSFRWAAINSMTEDELTFPIDRHVLTLLKKTYNS